MIIDELKGRCRQSPIVLPCPNSGWVISLLRTKATVGLSLDRMSFASETAAHLSVPSAKPIDKVRTLKSEGVRYKRYGTLGNSIVTVWWSSV